MKQKGLILVFATALISGLSIFINRFGVAVINPYIFTGLKNLVVAILLLGFIFLLKERKKLAELKIKQWLTLFLIGLIGGSIPFLLFFKGLSLTSGAQASFIHKTMFIYVIVMALLFLKEKMSRGLIIGILLLLLGNFLLLKVSLASQWGRGDLLILLATLFWAVEQVISKRALKTISPRIVAWGRMFFGFCLIFLFWLVTGQVQLLGQISFNQMAWVGITALFLFGYVVTWYTGLKYVPVSTAVCVLALGGPVTALMSLIYKGSLTFPQISGILMIVLAIALITKTSYERIKISHYLRLLAAPAWFLRTKR